jgi:hypothetical protein
MLLKRCRSGVHNSVSIGEVCAIVAAESTMLGMLAKRVCCEANRMRNARLDAKAGWVYVAKAWFWFHLIYKELGGGTVASW